MRAPNVLLLPLAGLALAGCVGTPPSPQGVDVSESGIEVAMSDRSTCIGTAPNPGVSWSGVLSGCNSPYPYRVIFDTRTNPLREGLEAVVGAIGIDLAPVATVEIDGPAGNTWTFTSPPPDPDD